MAAMHGRTALAHCPRTPGTTSLISSRPTTASGVGAGAWASTRRADGEHRSAAANSAPSTRTCAPGRCTRSWSIDGDECVGWCQYGSPAELPNIKNPGAYAKELGELPDWRIGCIFTGKGHRGAGVARAAVAGALDAVRAGGGGLVEAYPEQVEGRPEQRGAYFHTGPETLFEEFGFTRDRQIASGVGSCDCDWTGRDALLSTRLPRTSPWTCSRHGRVHVQRLDRRGHLGENPHEGLAFLLVEHGELVGVEGRTSARYASMTGYAESVSSTRTTRRSDVLRIRRTRPPRSSVSTSDETLAPVTKRRSAIADCERGWSAPSRASRGGSAQRLRGRRSIEQHAGVGVQEQLSGPHQVLGALSRGRVPRAELPLERCPVDPARLRAGRRAACHRCDLPLRTAVTGGSRSNPERAQGTDVQAQRVDQRGRMVDREDVGAAELVEILVDDGRGGLPRAGVEVGSEDRPGVAGWAVLLEERSRGRGLLIVSFTLALRSRMYSRCSSPSGRPPRRPT